MYINHFFKYSACAQLIIAPLDNLIVGANLEACRLLKCDHDKLVNTTPAELFRDCLPDFMRLTKELMEQGRTWCDRLLMHSGDVTFRIEAHGVHSTVGKQDLLHLTFNRADEAEQLRDGANTDSYYRPGNNSSSYVALAFESLSREIAKHWPSNKRQLDDLAERHAILAHYDAGISTTTRPATPESIPATRSHSSDQPFARARVLTGAELKALELRNMIRALQQSQGRIFGPGGAAELLDIKPTTLSGRLKRNHIDRRWFLPKSDKQAVAMGPLPTDYDIPYEPRKTGTHA